VRQEKILVIGAGIAGLCSAIVLARRGFSVTVVERAQSPGGKMREIVVGGSRIDAGPTVLTMRWVFDEIFESAGASLDDHLTLRPAEVLARHAWGPYERLDLFADTARSADAIADFAGPSEAAGYLDFCRESKGIHDTLRDTFLTAAKTGPIGLARRVGLRHIDALIGIRPFETLWSALCSHFRDPRLRQLFGRYATYCGSSPFSAPATLMLIAHVEQQGVWLVEGGMQRLADALEALAKSLGVVFRYGAHVDRIELESGRVCAATLAGGERLHADRIVANTDAAAIPTGALGLRLADDAVRHRGAERSLSAITWAVRAPTHGFPLARHNVFFSRDYGSEFRDIFERGRPPRAPTLYVCAQDRRDGVSTAPGAERLLILMNAPADGDQRTQSKEELATCETKVFKHLSHCGLTIDRKSGTQVVTTPRQFESLFPATGGALYGRATHGWASAFKRPGAKTSIPGLYLAGGGAHPGAGVPMAALSGRLAAEQILEDHASTRPFHRVVMFGGMSTPSAMTAGKASR
jgi:1-hydroxycarotenoid 3,4-desaturase